MKIFKQVTDPPQLNSNMNETQGTSESQFSPVNFRKHNIKQILGNRKTNTNYKAQTHRKLKS